jgi:UDP-2,3-diacylglucosamine pyrophosphatase LpxH
MVGSEAYAWLLKVNRWFNAARHRLGFPYWSLSAFLKHKVKNAMTYVSNYEQAVVREARAAGVHGVICGHIHHAAISEIDGITYCNDGDWVESCTALVEHFDGSLELLDWTRRQTRDRHATPERKELAHANRDHQRRLVAAG